MRYFTPALEDEDSFRKNMQLELATEARSRLEVVESIVSMLGPARMARGVKSRWRADPSAFLNSGCESGTTGS
jgi:Mn-containing catalase